MKNGGVRSHPRPGCVFFRFLQKNFLEPAAAKRSTKSDVSAREQELESEVESQKQGGNQKQAANLGLPG